MVVVFLGRQSEDDDPDGTISQSLSQEDGELTSGTGHDTSERERFSSSALFTMIMLLIAALFTSYMLQQKKVEAVHETALSIFAGTMARQRLRARLTFPRNDNRSCPASD